MIHATCDLHHGHPGQVIRQDRGNREMKEMGCSGAVRSLTVRNPATKLTTDA